MRRRRYLRLSGLTAVTALAGCSGNPGNDDQTPTPTPTQTPATDTVAEEDKIDFGGVLSPPFLTESGEGEISGFEIELLRSGFGDSDLQIETSQSYENLDAIASAIAAGDVDIGGGHLEVTETDGVTFQPYYSADQTIAVKRGGSFTPESFSDFEGKSVAAAGGTEGEAVVQSQLIEPGIIAESEFQVTDTMKTALVKVENGDVAASLFDRPIGLSFEATQDVKVAFQHDTGVMYGFATATGAETLRKQIDRAVQRTRLNGGFQSLVIEWFAPEQ